MENYNPQANPTSRVPGTFAPRGRGRGYQRGQGSDRGFRGGFRGRGRGRGRGGAAAQANQAPREGDQGDNGDFPAETENTFVPYEKHPLSNHLLRPYYDTHRNWWVQWQEWDVQLYQERNRQRGEWRKEQVALKEKESIREANGVELQPGERIYRPVDKDEEPPNGPYRPHSIPLDTYQPKKSSLSSRLHYAAKDFRNHHPWPPQYVNPKYGDPEGCEDKILLGWVWDQLRLFMGLLGAIPVWNWVKLDADGNLVEDPRKGRADDDNWGSISDDEDAGRDERANGDAESPFPAKPPLPRRPYALMHYVPHTIQRQTQLDALRALSTFQRNHRLFKCLLDFEHAIKWFLSAYAYEKELVEAWCVVGGGKIGKVVQTWLNFLLNAAGEGPEEEAAVVTDTEKIPIPEVPSELQDLSELESMGSEKLMQIYRELVDANETARAKAQGGLVHVKLSSAIQETMKVAERSIIELQIANVASQAFPGDLGSWCGQQWGMAKWNERRFEPLAEDLVASQEEGQEKITPPEAVDQPLKLVAFGPIPPPGFRANKDNITTKVVDDIEGDTDLPQASELEDVTSNPPSDLSDTTDEQTHSVSAPTSEAEADRPSPPHAEPSESTDDWVQPSVTIPPALEKILVDSRPAVKQRNIRRIVEITPTSISFDKTDSDASTPRYTRVALEPWLDWRYNFYPEVQLGGALEVEGEEKPALSEVANFTSDDPRKETIVMLIEDDVLQKCPVKPGMGIVATWGKFRVEQDVRELDGLWYMERLEMVVPSYWTFDDWQSEDV
ncbi:hypothetical protein BKA70DRAFT_1180168 [Coprinopsis sp. MPI-PUGE-AT-0042]|nr:hypothetical protein BKA70DRAFT_1180168 [Coprinopsis sp. MPI-PUGE-AT-0042]